MPSNFTGEPQKHYAPFEVVIHNQPHDCWVSFLGKVLNITPLIKEFEHEACVLPLLAFAGKDISEWFDEKTGDIQHHVHPVAGVKVPYCPHGRIPHVDVQVPATRWRPLDFVPWWNDKKYEVGLLTKRVRPIRIVDTFLAKEYHVSVCCEDIILRIMERYSLFNPDATSYSWRSIEGKLLDIDLTLDENGIIDERERFVECGLSPTFYIPAVLIYYQDDFKWVSDDSDTEEY